MGAPCELPMDRGAPAHVAAPHRLLARGWTALGAGPAIVLSLVVAGAMAASFLLAGGLEGRWVAMVGALAAVAFVPVVAAVALVDARFFIIPNSLNAAGLALGLVYAATLGGQLAFPLEAAARGLALAAAFWALRGAYRALRGRDGLGLGDVKLAGVAGVWLEVGEIPLAIEIAALSALLAIGVGHLAGRGRLRLERRLPFGLFLAPAIWISWALGRALDLDLMAWGGF